MSLNVSALSTYTDQISGKLAKEILLASNTIKGDIVAIQYGAIGNAVQLNSIKSTVVGTTAACSAFASSGSTVMGATTVTLCPVKFEDSVCIDTLNKYYLSFMAQSKFNTEDLGAFEDVFVSNKVEATTKAIDQMVWRSATAAPNYAGSAATTGNLVLCNGFLEAGYLASASTVNVRSEEHT